MRVLTYRDSDGADRAGVQADGGVLDAGELLGGDAVGVRELLAAGRLDELAEARITGGSQIPWSEVELRPPVPDPEKIVCIGLNYGEHAAEAGIDPPALPDDLRQVPKRARPRGLRGGAAGGAARRSTTRPRSRS